MRVSGLQAPFPYFGGKRQIADMVWQAFGDDVQNYVEPFFGSGAVLLAREVPVATETVNDADGYLVNFWRAVQADPEAVAWWADWPVSELDLHARHLWLINERSDLHERCAADPAYYDVQAAGWWVWGACCWIGSGWCRGDGPWNLDETGQLAHLGNRGQGIHRQLAHLGNRGQGIHRKLAHLGNRGQGIHRKLAHLGNRGRGIHRKLAHLGDRGRGIQEWFEALQARLRAVRIVAGDWMRVVTDSVTWRHGITAIFLDPPYVLDGTSTDGLYRHHEDIGRDVAAWAIAHGDDPRLRIVYAGYTGTVTFPPTWREVRWKARGGYSSQNSRGNANAARETLWLSPHCQRASRAPLLDAALFGEATA